MTRTKPEPRCVHCRRPVKVCWLMPCLDLEIVLAQGVDEVNAWCEASGAPFSVTEKVAS